MGSGERTKGAQGERELVDILRARGFRNVRRNFGSGSQGGGDLTGLPGFHVESKRRERCEIWKWIEQAAREAQSDVPLVAFRRSRSPWMACLPLDDLLDLVLEARS